VKWSVCEIAVVEMCGINGTCKMGACQERHGSEGCVCDGEG
jgi:hypothetical protein